MSHMSVTVCQVVDGWRADATYSCFKLSRLPEQHALVPQQVNSLESPGRRPSRLLLHALPCLQQHPCSSADVAAVMLMLVEE